MWLNLSGTLNVFRLIKDPTLCLPQYTASTFNHLPIPLSKAFPKKTGKDGEKDVDIRAVVLDKDNCFAIPHTDEVHKPYKVGQFPRIRVVVTVNSYYPNRHQSSTSIVPIFTFAASEHYIPLYTQKKAVILKCR
jgi:hypothetical protein